jgi:EAL domain-containing protein (putative c-di-GMP-specific phosphodiesterase class I)
MVHLGHSVGSTTVAVGMERPAELKLLQAMGCDVGQGFLFGQALPHDRFMALLLERAKQTQLRVGGYQCTSDERAITPVS